MAPEMRPACILHASCSASSQPNLEAKIHEERRRQTPGSTISSYGLAIAGGRFAPVGVSGLLLGGVINWFGSEKGWSANTVCNYQIVLADGSIVNANAISHVDLF